jgi:hypothetical protein
MISSTGERSPPTHPITTYGSKSEKEGAEQQDSSLELVQCTIKAIHGSSYLYFIGVTVETDFAH